MGQRPTTDTRLSQEPPSVQWALAAVLVLHVAVVAAGIHRSGYSIDEEFTYFAVQGISARGVPVLPSGALENRGLPYTYSAWLSGALFGHGFPAYRYPSLLSGMVVIVLVFKLARFSLSPWAAVVASLGVALLPWQVFSAEWARFYAMFVASYLASLVLFLAGDHTAGRDRLWLFSVGFSHLLHEFAGTLLLLPAITWLVDRTAPGGRRRAVRLTLLAAAAFAASEGLLYLVHWLASAPPFRSPYGYAMLHALPVSWERTALNATAGGAYPPIPWLLGESSWRKAVGLLMGASGGAGVAPRLGVSRLLLAIVVILAGLEHYGRAWFVAMAWAFVRPTAAVRTTVSAAAAIGLTSITVSTIVALRSGSQVSTAYLWSTTQYAMHQVMAVFWILQAAYPATTACLGVVGVLAAWHHKSASMRIVRILVLVILAWLLTFDVLAVDFQPRYYVGFWPLFVLATVHLGYVVRPRPDAGERQGVHVALAISVVLVVMLEQHRLPDENRAEACVASGTLCVPVMRDYAIDPPAIAEARDRIAAWDVVICTDELACRLLLGRVDYWLYRGSIYAYTTGDQRLGLYGGSPILPTVDALQKLLERGDGQRRYWIVVPPFIKYPPWNPEEILDVVPSPLRDQIVVLDASARG